MLLSRGISVVSSTLQVFVRFLLTCFPLNICGVFGEFDYRGCCGRCGEGDMIGVEGMHGCLWVLSRGLCGVHYL